MATIARRELVTIADLLKKVAPPEDAPREIKNFWEGQVRKLAHELSYANERFNRGKFLNAAGVSDSMGS